MTEQEIKDGAPSGATGYRVAKYDGHITYYKNISNILYFFNGSGWEWSGFNEDIPSSQFHNFIKPL